jgi:hypothetical protein
MASCRARLRPRDTDRWDLGTDSGGGGGGVVVVHNNNNDEPSSSSLVVVVVLLSSSCGVGASVLWVTPPFRVGLELR